MMNAILGLFMLTAGVSAIHSSTHHGTNRFAGKSKSNVVAKVIEMLETEKSTIAEDIKKEAAAMAEYMDYCDDEQKAKDFAIRDADRVLEDTSALIEDNTAQIAALEEEIAEIGVQMADRQEEHDKIKKLRDERHAEFKKREAEQTVMISELVKMEKALKEQIDRMTTPPPVETGAAEEGEEAAAEGEAAAEAAPEAPPAAEGAPAALLQKSSWAHPHLSPETVQNMKVLYQTTMNALMQDPEAAPKGGAFLQEHQPSAESANTADNLASFEGLKVKAREALQRERDQEKKEVNEFMVEKQSLMGAMTLFNSKLDDANEDKNRLSEEKAQAEAENAQAKESKAADEKALAELVSTCNAASESWDARQKDAAAEQAAITKACEILGSRVKVFLQVGDSKAEKSTAPTAVRQRLITKFRTLGSKLHSISMLNMVSAMSVTPMEKIKGLISDMIEKLQKEAAEAANMHAFCQEETKANKEANEKTQKELDTINNRLEAALAKKQSLTDRVSELQAQIKDIESADAEALKIRTDENEVFVKQEADFKEAAAAVDDAIDVLKDFYGDVGIGAALVQQPAAPPKLGGRKDASAGGILSILDMMSDQFSTTVDKLQREEREATEAYEKLTNDNEVSKTNKLMEIKTSESQIMSLTEAAGDYTVDKTEATKTMDAIVAYAEKLKPQCENRVVPYAERKAKREAEIEGLKEAFQILVDTADSMGGFLQTHSHPTRRFH
jgi:DNA repair exonuclease SbcCD ATPase subunit